MNNTVIYNANGGTGTMSSSYSPGGEGIPLSKINLRGQATTLQAGVFIVSRTLSGIIYVQMVVIYGTPKQINPATL